jgi:hypothetical protein
MSTPNRWAVRDVAKATFYSLTTGKPVVKLETLKTSGVETSSETVYSRGGSGNAKLVGFSSNREAKIALQDAIIDNKALAILTGNDLVTAVKEIYYDEKVTVTATAATLTKTPVGSLLGVYLVAADGTDSTEYTLGTPSATPTTYSIIAKAMTFNSAVNSSQFHVYYKVDTDATAKTVSVTSDKFGGSYKLVLDCIIRDEYTKADFAGQIICVNVKVEDNFKFSFEATGDPSVLDIPIEVLKSSTDTNMWYMVIYDDDLIL